MIISDKIYINLDKEPVKPEVLPLLTYKNPEYYQKMNMGLGVWGVPKTLQTYMIKDRIMTVLRGEAWKLADFSPTMKIEPSHPIHKPVDINYVNNDFPLDEFQEEAVKAILSKKQGVIHAVTSAGKSLIILKAICERKLPALIVVHRKLLMEQFLTDIKKYVKDSKGQPISPGIIGNGSFTFGAITIAIDRTAARLLDKIKQRFAVTFLDECHLAPANTILNTINTINSEYRFGVSGTLRRKDQKEFLIFATFGRVIYTITKEQLLDLNRIVPVELKIIESETKFDLEGATEKLQSITKAYQLMQKTIHLDPTRSRLILELLYKLRGKTMVLSRLVEPCYRLSEALSQQYGRGSGIITGKDTKKALASYENMKYSDLDVIFATIGCVSTGISISDLDNIILISPLYTNELLLHQIRGRLMRMSEGKTKGTLYYIYDPYIFPIQKLNNFIKIMNL